MKVMNCRFSSAVFPGAFVRHSRAGPGHDPSDWRCLPPREWDLSWPGSRDPAARRHPRRETRRWAGPATGRAAVPRWRD